MLGFISIFTGTAAARGTLALTIYRHSTLLIFSKYSVEQ